MSVGPSQIAAPGGNFMRRSSVAVVDAISGNRVLNKGFRAGATALNYLQQCLIPRLDIARDRLDSSVPPPASIIEQLGKYKNAQNKLDEFNLWLSQKNDPTDQVYERIGTAIERLRERMAYNRQFEGPKETYDELGQRLEDLQHCQDAIGRDYDTDHEYLQALDDTVRLEGKELIEMIEDWLLSTFGISQQRPASEFPAFNHVFDLKILEDAEVICEQREAADQQEEAELRGLPLQPEDATMSRAWIMHRAEHDIREARYMLEEASQDLEQLKEAEAADDAAVYPQPSEDLQEALNLPDDDSAHAQTQDDEVDWNYRPQPTIEELQDSVRRYTDELHASIQIGRQLGLDVADNGSITETGPPARASSRCTEMLVLWGAQQEDNEREPTDEEYAEMQAEAARSCEPWANNVDIEMSPNDLEVPIPSPPGTPAGTEVELTEPQVSDSVSQPDHNRIDLGYSVYRCEIDRMDELREQMRAQLPGEAKPLKDGESSC